MRFRPYRITLILGLAMLGLVPGLAASQTQGSFWPLDRYLEARPEQAALSRAFEAAVSAPATPFSGRQERPVRVVMVYPGLQYSDYWRRSVASFRARMNEMGIAFTLEDHFTKPGTDVRLQSRLIGEAMEDAPDYLIFTLDALRHRGIIERVMARGRTKVILQNITTPLRAFGDYQPFLYVGFDHGVGAKALADAYKAAYPDGARYAIFYGPVGYVSDMRGGTFEKEMATHPGMRLVASYYVNFDRDRSYKAALELLRSDPDIDFIYACSTDIAHGIIDALKDTGRLGDVRVNGWGGGSTELAAIEAGELDFTVMRMNDDNGVAMAEAIRMDLEGEGARVPTVFSGAFAMVPRGIDAEELERLRAHAFRYSD